jgi:hypothetical protein
MLWYFSLLFLWKLHLAKGLSVGDEIWCVTSNCFSCLSCGNPKDSLIDRLELISGGQHSVEGYIMDEFCISLGTLLDNPSVRTLENPGVHSLHW